MLRLTVSDLHSNTESLLEQISSQHETAVVSSSGKVTAVILSADDPLLEELEDRLDIADAEAAMAEPGERITIAEFQRRRGL